MSSKKSRSAIQNLILAIAASAALLGGYYLGNMASGKKPELQTATLIPEPRAIDDFELVDFNNQPFTLEDLKGQWNLIFFGYTNCPDICPTALSNMAEVRQALDADVKEQTRIIFISVDPQRDTPDHLKKFVSFFDPDFFAVTGEDDQLQALTKQLALRYKLQTPDDKGNYLVDHSAWLIIVNPQGQFHAVISGSHYPNPKGIASDINIIVD